jgi:hypothetical protein
MGAHMLKHSRAINTDTSGRIGTVLVVELTVIRQNMVGVLLVESAALIPGHPIRFAFFY